MQNSQRQEKIEHARELAKAYIESSTSELRTQGIEPKFAIEQYVFLKNKDGTHCDDLAIDLEALKSKGEFGYIRSFKQDEGVREPDENGNETLLFKTHAYEIHIENESADGKTVLMNAMEVADAVDDLRKKLPKYFEKYEIAPHFSSRDSESSPETAGMHINMSLWTRDDNSNIFGYEVLLNPPAYATAQAILDIQDSAPLGFAPTGESYGRYDVLKDFGNHIAPEQIYVHGLGAPANVAFHRNRRSLRRLTDQSGNYEKNNHHSLIYQTPNAIVGNPNEVQNPDLCRLENRMPAADADPYISIALTLAGAIQASKDLNPKSEYKNEISQRTQTPIPKNIEDATALMKRSLESRKIPEDLRELFAAIIEAYGVDRNVRLGSNDRGIDERGIG